MHDVTERRARGAAPRRARGRAGTRAAHARSTRALASTGCAVAGARAVAALEEEDVVAGERRALDVELGAREIRVISHRLVERVRLDDRDARRRVGRSARRARRARATATSPSRTRRALPSPREAGLEIELRLLVAATVVELADAVVGGERHVTHGELAAPTPSRIARKLASSCTTASVDGPRRASAEPARTCAGRSSAASAPRA